MKRVIALLLVFVMTLTVTDAGMKGTAKAADYRDKAVNLTLNGSWSGEKWITNSDSEHWYKLVIPSDGSVEMKVMSYIGETLWYRVYNQDLSEELYYNYAYNGSATQPTTAKTEYVLSKGTYYLKIYNEYREGKYKINAKYTNYGVNDGNANSFDSPQSYALGSQITGAITATDDADWYKITISSNGYYVINIKSYIGETLWYRVYNQDLSEEIYYDYAYNGSTTQPTTVKTEYVLSKGTYYLKIYNEYHGGKYIFNLNKLSQSNCEHDYATSYVESTYLANGYAFHTCKKCGKSYKDNYTSKKVLLKGYIWSYGLQSGKKKFKVSYQGISDVSGYQIRYSTDRKLKKGVKIVKAGKYTTAKTIKNLKKKKRYYVQVRGYKKVKGKTVYGKWSTKRSVKTR